MILLYKVICFIEKILSRTKYKHSSIICFGYILFLSITISSIPGLNKWN